MERIYGGTVNYRDPSGTWRHIDTDLRRDGDVHRTTAGDTVTRVPTSLDDGAASVTAGPLTATLQPEGLKAEAQVDDATATFEGAAPGVDFELSALSTGLRHTTTLSGTGAPKQLTFDLHVSAGAKVAPRADGSATITSVDGKHAMELSPSFGWVGKDLGHARRVSTTIEAAGSGWRVRADLGATWIREALRDGKTVTVDPTLTTAAGQNNATIMGFNPTVTGYADSTGLLMVANLGGGNQARSALQFALDSVPEGARVLDAKIGLYGEAVDDQGNFPHKISLHEITTGWDSAGASWNTKAAGQNWAAPGGDVLPAAAATTDDVRTDEGWAYWKPTQLVQRWVSGESANYGVMLVEADTTSRLAFFSSRTTTEPTHLPYLQVRYAPPAGQRRDDTYVSEDLNDRTSMGVGVATGNLLLSSQDVSIAGLGQPLSFARSYNTGLVDYQTGAFGNGGTGGLTGDVHLVALGDGGKGLQLGDGSYYRYNSNGSGGYTPAARLEADLVRKSDGTHELTYRRSQAKWLFRTDGKLSQIVDKHQNAITLGYTGTGVLNQLTDTQGRVLPVTMNANGRITKIMDPTGRSWNYTYSGPAGNRLATYTDPSGGVTRYAYDSDNRLKKLTTPGGRITEIVYDTDGRVSKYTRITDVDEESGPTTRFRYDQPDSRCQPPTGSDPYRTTVMTDPRGNETTYCINGSLQVEIAIDAKGHERQTKYTSQGQVEKFTDGTGSGSAINTATYSGLTNNLESTEGAMHETTTFGYGSGSSLTEKYQPTSQTAPDGQQQFFGYNAQGDVTSVKDSQTAPNQQATLTYNPDGTIATAKDGENRQTSYGYWTAADGGARKGLLKTFAPPAPRAATTLNYDTLGRVSSATDGNGNTTTYSYDKLDRVKTTTFAGGAVFTSVYDADGNQTDTIDTEGGAESATYDALNRRISETLTGDRATAYGYDAAGNLVQVADDFGITGYGYDELNRTCYVAPTDAGGGSCATPPSGATTFKYDGAGRRLKTSYPNGVNVDEAPDLSGKPTAITAGTGANAVSRNYGYAAFPGGTSGTLVQTMQVNGGDTATYSYDGSARLATVKIGAAAGVDQVTYTYDKAGNRTGFAVGANPANTIAPYTATSTYNGANQLVTQTRNTKTDGASTETFAYDGAGNDDKYGYNARNQMTWGGPGSLVYRGVNQADLRRDGGAGSEYDIESNLLGVSRRYAPPNDAATSFLRSPDGELLARRTPAGAWSYYAKDALGSVIGVYDAAGTLTKKYDYDPDGNVWRDSSGKPEDFGYTGAYTRLGAQTLYHNGLRWYDPKTARWTQADSLDQPRDLQDANPYLYVGSNPINYIDPLGLYSQQNDCPPAKEAAGSCNRPGKPTYGSGYPGGKRGGRGPVKSNKWACYGTGVAIGGASLYGGPPGALVGFFASSIVGLYCTLTS